MANTILEERIGADMLDRALYGPRVETAAAVEAPDLLTVIELGGEIG